MVGIPEQTSPIHLIQEDYIGQPWPVLVASIMLNRTSHVQVRPVLALFLRRWPAPDGLSEVDAPELTDMIRTLGFQNVRARRLIDLAKVVSPVLPCTIIVDTLPGVGRYVRDAYTLFVKRELVQGVSDEKLRRYVEWTNGFISEDDAGEGSRSGLAQESIASHGR